MRIRKRSGIEIKQSRSSFLYNYVLIVLALVFFGLIVQQFNIVFILSPQNLSELSKTSIVIFFVLLVGFLIEEPEIRRWFCTYKITNNEVIKVEGVIIKRRTMIPYQSVANVSVYKGVLGRILDFGDVDILGFKDHINMRGIREPEVFYRIINNKIARMRGSKHAIVSVEEGVDSEKIMSMDWKSEQKALEKKVQPLEVVLKDTKKKKIDIFGFLKKPKTPAEEIEKEEELEDIEENIPKKKERRRKKTHKPSKKTKRKQKRK